MLDVIASRSRLAILRRLDRAPNSSASELAAATGLHLNTIRSHLGALESAGLVERATRRSGRRGRPAWRYRMRRSTAPRREELLPLSALLADALESLGGEGRSAVRVQGAEWGRRWSLGRGDESPSERLCSALERLGFVVTAEGGRVRLSGCPCPFVSGSRPQLVCGLADAVTDGVLESTSLRASRRRHNSKRRRCQMDLVSVDDRAARV